ncbi:MAG: dihydrodipicolinate synthase family protein [Armatimonadota bacterium]|nr:dihydrodipicolinate synthase family protein [Armatimonadota bacterium]
MNRFAGIFPILQTPFDESGAVDTESLRREVAFCLNVGAHGLVIPANASEFFTLSDAERLHITEVVLEEARGRVPVIISCNAVSTRAALGFVRHAVAHGADGIMVLPPYVRRLDEAGVLAYYEAVAEAADGRPVIVQNAEPPLGTPLSTNALIRLMERAPGVCYVKEEVNPSGHRISALIRAAGDRLRGVFGGQNGLLLLSELDRGACGNMPACGIVDVQVQIYELYSAGRRKEAEALQQRLLPLLVLGSQYGVAFAKELLWRRGVIRTKVVRDPQAVPLDQWDLADLQRYLEKLRSVLTSET